MSHVQPIDSVKRSIESFLPTAYLMGIAFVYIASAAVMTFLLYHPFLAFIDSSIGALIASILISTAIQFMRFLIVFTDSLTAGKNDSKGVVWLVSIVMLVLSIFEVYYGVAAIRAAVAIAVSSSSLMLAGCVLELLFVKKLNRRDLELEAIVEKGPVPTSSIPDPLMVELLRELRSITSKNGHVPVKP